MLLLSLANCLVASLFVLALEASIVVYQTLEISYRFLLYLLAIQKFVIFSKELILFTCDSTAVVDREGEILFVSEYCELVYKIASIFVHLERSFLTLRPFSVIKGYGG